MRRLTKLSDTHYAAIRMKIDGVRTPEIAKRLRMKERTLHLLFCDDLAKEEIDRQRERIDQVFAEKVAGAAFAAVDQLVGMASMPLTVSDLTVAQKLEVLDRILNRTQQLPTNGERIRGVEAAQTAALPVGENGSGGVVNNLLLGLGDASTADLTMRARELAARIAGSPNVIDSRPADSAAN